MKFQKGDLVAVDVSGWYQTIGIVLDDEPDRRPHGFIATPVVDRAVTIYDSLLGLVEINTNYGR